MLFMVVETIQDVDAVGERFRRQGRMLPANVQYLDSWMSAEGDRCYQLMEAPSQAELDEWARRWDDLGSFEIIPVETSAAYWAKRG